MFWFLRKIFLFSKILNIVLIILAVALLFVEPLNKALLSYIAEMPSGLLPGDWRNILLSPSFNDFHSIIIVLFLFLTPASLTIFTNLIGLIDNVNSGTNLSIENSKRLSQIAASLLHFNIIGLFFSYILSKTCIVMGECYTSSPSIMSWFVIVIIYVLAIIFNRDSRMGDGLEGRL